VVKNNTNLINVEIGYLIVYR